MELTEEKEKQIVRLLQVITEESALFRKTSPKSVVKIPFSTLEIEKLHSDKAETLIGCMNTISGSYEEGAIEILNGTIHEYGGVIGTLHTGVFEELENVKIDDSERFLLLWLHNFGKLKKKVMDSLHFNGDTTPQHMVIDDTPEGANWSSLQIRFINGRTLLASFPIKSWNRNIGASELGLEKKGSQRPKEQWLLLEEAARNNGQIRLSIGKKKESKRRQVNMLQHLLNEVFPKLDGQPFEACGGDAYRCVFIIETEQREDNLLDESTKMLTKLMKGVGEERARDILLDEDE